MYKAIIKFNTNLQSGYTLLFAVLVSSLVLVVGISILTLSKKEFLISASSRDSMVAIYAASSALECFVYSEDKKGSAGLGDGDFYTSGLNCGSSMGVPLTNSIGNTNTLTFSAKMSYPYNEGGVRIDDNACAFVSVNKTRSSGRWSTTIESRGYNTGWNGSDCNGVSSKKVERAIRLSY